LACSAHFGGVFPTAEAWGTILSSALTQPRMALPNFIKISSQDQVETNRTYQDTKIKNEGCLAAPAKK